MLRRGLVVLVLALACALCSGTAWADAGGPDTTPPVTIDDVPTTSVQGPVTVTLTATDDDSGVLFTWYAILNGPDDTSAPSVPYDPAAKPVLQDGQSIRYSSTDKALNQEVAHTSATVHVQTEPEPTATPTATPDPTATPTPDPTATSTPEATPEATATATPTATAEPTATPSPEPTPTAVTESDSKPPTSRLTGTVAAAAVLGPQARLVLSARRGSLGCVTNQVPLGACMARIVSAGGTVLAQGYAGANGQRSYTPVAIRSTPKGVAALRRSPAGVTGLVMLTVELADGRTVTSQAPITLVETDGIALPIHGRSARLPSATRRELASVGAQFPGASALRCESRTRAQARAACLLLARFAPGAKLSVVRRARDRRLLVTVTP